MREQRYPEAAHGTYRSWQLHVWELTGPPADYQEAS